MLCVGRAACLDRPAAHWGRPTGIPSRHIPWARRIGDGSHGAKSQRDPRVRLFSIPRGLGDIQYRRCPVPYPLCASTSAILGHRAFAESYRRRLSRNILGNECGGSAFLLPRFPRLQITIQEIRGSSGFAVTTRDDQGPKGAGGPMTRVPNFQRVREHAHLLSPGRSQRSR
jgi:hypothetical protein